MPDLLVCSRCGQTVLTGAPAGQCPACLLRLGLFLPNPDDTPHTADSEMLATREYREPASTIEVNRFIDSTISTDGVEFRTTAAGGPVVGGRPVQFGNYELREELGRGGMGVVFRAIQAIAGREVAVKVLLGGVAGEALHGGRFAAEVSALAQLRHPNIVTVYEVGEVNGSAFFSMEYAPNGTLAGRLKTGHLSLTEAALLLGKLAEATEAAHQLGVLHRDIKPGNVLLADDGEPKLSDFGLAKWIHRDDALTASGAVMGTPSYMPPEQARGAKQVGPAADVYSLGATLYECLTGRPPFRGTDPYSVMQRVLTQEPDAPRTLRPHIQADLEAVCQKCLAKDPAKRYASAHELAADLARWRNGASTVARPLTRTQRVRRRIRKHWQPVGAALLIALGATGLVWALNRQPPQPIAAIEAALQRGEAVTLIGPTGPPKYHRWVFGVGVLDEARVESAFLVQSNGNGLLELVPNTHCDRFRLSVEFKQDESLTQHSTVGLYFGHRVGQPNPAGVLERAVTVEYSIDMISDKPRFRQGNPVVVSDSLFGRTPAGAMQKITSPLGQLFMEHEPIARLSWRKVVAEVTPDVIRIDWLDAENKFVPLRPGGIRTDVVNKNLELKHPDAIAADFPGTDPTGLDFSPRGGVGLYVRDARVFFRNVVLEPLGP